jgi:hypothetical protein
VLLGWLNLPSVRGPAVRRPKQAVPTRLQWIVTGNFEDRVSGLCFPAQGRQVVHFHSRRWIGRLKLTLFFNIFITSKEVLSELLRRPVTRYSE